MATRKKASNKKAIKKAGKKKAVKKTISKTYTPAVYAPVHLAFPALEKSYEAIRWLNYTRSPKPERFIPNISDDFGGIKDEYGREVFTGRHMIRINKDVSTSHLESLAKNASIKLASVENFKMNDGARSMKLLSEADGVIFPTASVAMVNPRMEDQLSFLTSSIGGQGHFNYGEPERYVYPAAESANTSSFTDNNSFTWALQATNVLQSTRTGSGIRVAVLDTGLNFNHPDFKNRNVTRESFIDGEDSVDVLGHGTRCAGIVCGVRAKIGARYGVASNVELLVGKVIAKNDQGTDNSLLDGIEWALANQCKVVNLSVVRAIAIGETGFSQTYEDLAAKALAGNCLIIAAAGNESKRRFHVIKPVAEPANCPSIMAVGALDKNIGVADFSCGGLNSNGGQIDIAAPGVDILSAHLKSTYNLDSGTSFACPMVAGMATLLWEENPTASASQIWMKLVQNAKRLNLNASDVGAGLAFLP